MRPVNRGAAPTRPGGSQKLYKTYGDLRIDLIARIGEYCSYCEVPLGVNLAIEHMLSKSWAINEIDWNNSLLACTNCNSHKKDATLSEGDINNYYWPSIPALAAPFNTFDMLQYSKANVTLQSLIGNGLLRLPAARASRPYVQVAYNMVWVSVNPAYVGTLVEPKIKQTIILTGLNDYVPDNENPKVSDRRIVNRTLAWDRAVLSADALYKYYLPYNGQYAAALDDQQRNAAITDAAGDIKIKLLKGQIKALVVATGFWSVWVTIFKGRTFINDEVRKALICELFIQPFAGTRLPFSGITVCP